ncbi:hypothetical protein GCM10010302_63290 [Streptomyces polychromogenes]|uniref:Uncharacterized protein n=1 Tax=Streptomyces polychromogenes TaxID=67342 RepID=A0ABN0VS50_9ACTN
MTLREGQRVRLAADIGVGEATARPDGAVVAHLSLAAGTAGTVERVDGQRPPGHVVLEYERLMSLLGDYGHTMPAESRKRLEEEVAALEPEWRAFEEEGARVTVRVRLDNGFVLDGAHEDVLTPA